MRRNGNFEIVLGRESDHTIFLDVYLEEPVQKKMHMPFTLTVLNNSLHLASFCPQKSTDIVCSSKLTVFQEHSSSFNVFFLVSLLCLMYFSEPRAHTVSVYHLKYSPHKYALR